MYQVCTCRLRVNFYRKLRYYQKLFLDFKRFQEGNIHLTMSVGEISEGISVRCQYGTDNIIKGVSVAKINGKAMPGPLLMKYSINRTDNVEWQRSVICVLFILVILAIASYIMIKIPESKKSGTVLMFVEAIASFLVISLIYPTLTLEPIVWAEAATDYYKYASGKSIMECLQFLEAGLYLSEIPMFISLLIIRILNIETFSFYPIQMLSVFFACMCTAPICMHYFRKYFDRKVRFALALMVSCYLFSPDDLTIINVAYIGAAFLVITFIYDFEEMSMPIYILTLIIEGFICLSKMAFLVFFPVGVFFLILFWKRSNVRKRLSVMVLKMAAACAGFMSE